MAIDEEEKAPDSKTVATKDDDTDAIEEMVEAAGMEVLAPPAVGFVRGPGGEPYAFELLLCAAWRARRGFLDFGDTFRRRGRPRRGGAVAWIFRGNVAQAEIEVVQETFVREFNGDAVSGPDAERPYLPRDLDVLRRKLAERTMVRLVGLSCHLVYWNVIRPPFERTHPHRAASHQGPTDKEKAQLFTEALSCHGQLHAELTAVAARVDTMLMPVVHLALRCAIERVFVRAFF